MRQCYVFWRTWCLFGENDLLTPVTPNDPWWIFRTITFVEGVKLMHMHKSRINAKYFVGLDAFLVKMTFLTPMTSDPIIVCAWVVVNIPVTVTKFGQNWMYGSMWKRRVARKKERRKKEEERGNEKKTVSCGCAGRIKRN